MICKEVLRYNTSGSVVATLFYVLIVIETKDLFAPEFVYTVCDEPTALEVN